MISSQKNEQAKSEHERYQRILASVNSSRRGPCAAIESELI